MVTIIRPQSSYGAYNDSSAFILEWSCDISGQSGYEIYYKLSDSSSWLSTGKITSTDTTYNLGNIYSLLGVDFTEITYKVKIYYNTTNNEGALTGTEESDIYTIVFRQPASGYLKVYDGEETQSYPLFNSISNNSLNKLNIKKTGGTFVAPLLDTTSPVASELKIKVGEDNKAIANSYATGLAYTANDTPGEFDQASTMNTYSYTYKGSYYLSSYYYYYYSQRYDYNDWNSISGYTYYNKSYYYYEKLYSYYYYGQGYTYTYKNYTGYKYNGSKKYSYIGSLGIGTYYTYPAGPSSTYYTYKTSGTTQTKKSTTVGYYYYTAYSYKYVQSSNPNYSYYYYSSQYYYSKNYTYRYYT